MAIIKILITYDISSKHSEVKKGMLAKGYKDTVLDANNKKVYLPNTSLVIEKEGMTAPKAVDDLKAVIEAVNASPKIKLERAFSVQYTFWGGVFGEPHQ